MNDKQVIFFCQNILSDENRAQFNRTRFLCRNFSTHIVGIAPISVKARHDAASVRLFTFGKHFKWFFPLWALWNIHRVKKLSEDEIAFLYSTYYPLNIITSYIAKRLFRIKWAADIWDDPEKSLLTMRQFTRNRHPFLSLLKSCEFLTAKKFLKYADKVVTLIEKEVRQKYSVPQHKLLSVTNGINLEYNFEDNLQGKIDDIFTLLYCGTIDQIRLEGIFSCLKELVQQIFPIRLILVGYELNNGYKWVRNELSSLTESVILDLRGVQSYDYVIKAIGESDVCICPYPDKLDLAPAYPVKLFDYMAIGRPIVASSLPGTKKIIKHGYNGLLFSPGNYLEMSEALKKLHDSPQLRTSLSQNALKSVSAFDWNKINDKILGFLET